MVFPYSFSTFQNPNQDWFSLLDEDIYKLVRSGICGGPSILYTRYHEKGITFLHPHEFGVDALPCQSILGVKYKILFIALSVMTVFFSSMMQIIFMDFA